MPKAEARGSTTDQQRPRAGQCPRGRIAVRTPVAGKHGHEGREKAPSANSLRRCWRPGRPASTASICTPRERDAFRLSRARPAIATAGERTDGGQRLSRFIVTQRSSRGRSPLCELGTRPGHGVAPAPDLRESRGVAIMLGLSSDSSKQGIYMANSAEARKRARQAEKTRQRNAGLKSSLRSAVKKLRESRSRPETRPPSEENCR